MTMCFEGKGGYQYTVALLNNNRLGQEIGGGEQAENPEELLGLLPTKKPYSRGSILIKATV
jgi:hypothetical protein